MKANMLDDIGDVGADECQVLKGPGETPELSRISNRRPGSGGDLGLRVHGHRDRLVVHHTRDLGLRVHGHRDRLVVHHTSALKDVESELALSKEESICLMLYIDPQKMMKRADVLHGESPLEGRYGVLQEHCARCNKRNVINIKQQLYRIGAVAEDEQRGVRLGLNKSQGEEVCGEPAVPSSRHLLQPVERLVEAADPIRLHGLNKPHWLATIDCLRESTMQKHVLHIKLVDRSGT
jgi:hypothetical protein